MIVSSGAMRRLGRVGAWLLASTLGGGLSAAQTLEPSAPRSSTSAAASAVEVVLVGGADSRPLAQLVQATLARQGVSLHLSEIAELREADLLDPPSGNGGPSTRVWIELVDPELARLYFAEIRLGRYLMRDVPLRSGLDELGRERIAQVIETSTQALLRGETAMSREQFENSLQTLETPSGTEPAGDREPPPDGSPRRYLTEPTLGVSYQSYWSGSELGLMHGPGLRVGLVRTLERGSFLGTAVVAPSFPQVHQEGGVEVRVQSIALRLLLGGAWPIGRGWSWSTSGGGGVSLSHISPRGLEEDWIEEPARTNVTPWLQAELGVNWELSRLMVSVAFSSQLSLADTHYDHVRGTEQERLFTPWLLQPGGVVGVTWH